MAYFNHLDETSIYALGLGLLGFAIIAISKKVSDKIPAYLVSIVAVSIIAFLFNLPVDTIGSRFPQMPDGLPMPTLPSLLMFRMVFSTPLRTSPSPAKNCCPFRYISYPKIPASTATAIFAAQEGFAPSQTTPDAIAKVLTMVCAMAS